MFSLRIKKVSEVWKLASKIRCIQFESTDVAFPNKLDSPKKLGPKFVESFSPHIMFQIQKEPNAKHLPIYLDAVRELINFSEFSVKLHDLKEAQEHFVKAMDYNLSGGGEHSIRISQEVFKHLVGEDKNTPENNRKVYLLGWASEMMVMSILMCDDMLDFGRKRRGKTCWYRHEDAKLLAVNDIMMVQNACYLVLKRFFGHLPCYLNMIQTMNEISFLTMMGQSNDILMRQRCGVSNFTLEKLKCVINAKGSYCFLYTPFILPMLFTGYDLNKDKQLFDDIKTIMCEIGYLAQIQNDFMDLYTDSNVTKKTGNDIENGAFCWLSTMVMELGSEQQKDVMKKFYGKDDPLSIEKIKQLYDDLNLPDVFKIHHKRVYDDIKHQIKIRLKSNESLQKALREISGWILDQK